MIRTLIKEIFIILLSGIANASNHTKCVLLSNWKCEIQPGLINLYRNEFMNYSIIHL